MECKIDDAPGVVDTSAKLLELQYEWERSCAFLAQLEADIRDGAANGGKTAAQPTACVEAVIGDDADLGNLNPNRYPVISSTDILNGRGRSGSQSGTSCKRGTVEGIPVDISQEHRPSVAQINMKFQPSNKNSTERVLVEEMLSSSSSSVSQPGLLQVRQPKPLQLQRAMSLHQKLLPPVHHVRLHRRFTFGEVPMPNGQGACHVERTAPAPGPFAPKTLSVPKAFAAPTIPDESALTTVRRFSMDHEHLSVTSALVPTARASCAQRRISIACGEAAVGRLSGSGSTASVKEGTRLTRGFRKMEPFPINSEAGAATCDTFTNSNNLSARRHISYSGSGSSGISVISRPSDLRADGGKSSPAPPTPPARGQSDTGHPPGFQELAPLLWPSPPPPPAMTVLPAVVPTNSRGTLGGPTDGLLPLIPSSLRCLSIKCSRTESSTGSGCGDADCGGTPSGVPENDGADPLMSLSPRASQPRVIIGQAWQRELQQQQPSGALSSSADSGSPCLPYEAVGARRYFRSMSMPRPHMHQSMDGMPAPRQPHPLQPYERTEEGPLPQAAVDADPQSNLRAKSMVLLKLKGIPEEESAGRPPRRSTGQFSEPCSPSGLNQSITNRSNSNRNCVRFAGRLVHEVMVPSYASVPSCISASGVQVSARSRSSRSLGLDAFRSISEDIY
ncbi:hypothetical protein Vretimale_15549 [Volvox reticuliferus]|uniref:Uncharacterized protein n=1 Tax=Volvox reticuliferus TaxID=1737510 RepID=A0A8J4CU96_9CHLO|nr:hypothetical protein Vretifemale_15084 [Volvox reticuliferus]GIM12129.1 hypothetical protein Vretimale_15549 [Volvox reticuliferus]